MNQRAACPPPELRVDRTNFSEVYPNLKNWWVVSPIASTGVRIPNTAMTTAGNLPADWALDVMGYAVEIPVGHVLWSLSVDYPSASGTVLLGLNHAPIPVRVGVLFNLSTTEFPCDILGPGKIIIMDPADDVNFEAIVAER